MIYLKQILGIITCSVIIFSCNSNIEKKTEQLTVNEVEAQDKFDSLKY